MGFFARRRRERRAQREAYAKMRAAGFGFEYLDAPTMGVDEFSDHRKADSGAFDMPALRRFSLVERLEDAVALIGEFH